VFEKGNRQLAKKDFDGRRSSLESPLFAAFSVVSGVATSTELQSSIAEEHFFPLERDEMIAIVGRALCTQFLKSQPQKPRQTTDHVKDLESEACSPMTRTR
jgi:hypothetical protein